MRGKEKIHYYMFRSRNKDNKDLKGFKERSKIFLLKDNDGFPDYALVEEAYKKFVAEGVPGEQSRLYMAANTRDPEIINKKLIAKLALESPDITNIQKVVNSIAMETECRNSSYWIIDFDDTRVNILEKFVDSINDINHNATGEEYLVTLIQTTPNGYAIVTSHGFDIRPLQIQFTQFHPDVDYNIMRDNLLFEDILTPETIDTPVHIYQGYEPIETGEFDWETIKKEREELNQLFLNKEADTQQHEFTI